MSAPGSISLNKRMSPKKPFAGPSQRRGSPGSPPFTSGADGPHHATVEKTTRYRVDELMKGAREIILVHRGQEYHLRITSTGKLILTK
jgi:hemin uptake protein HemP